MIKGTVKWFSSEKGFGFIQANGQDYFAHFRQIKADGYKTLNPGQQVEFEEGASPKGQVANNIVPIEIF